MYNLHEEVQKIIKLIKYPRPNYRLKFEIHPTELNKLSEELMLKVIIFITTKNTISMIEDIDLNLQFFPLLTNALPLEELSILICGAVFQMLLEAEAHEIKEWLTYNDEFVRMPHGVTRKVLTA